MANQLYGKGRNSFLTQNPAIDWDADNIKIFLIRSASYPAFNIDTDQYLSDVPAAARVGNSAGQTRADAPLIPGRSGALGVANGTNTTLLTVPAGAACQWLLIFKDDGAADASSPLIALLQDATGLPVTPNGGDIIIQWDAGVSKIFKL